MNFKKLFDYSQPLVAAMTLFVVTLIGLAYLGSQVVYNLKLADDTIEVTGSTKESVVADTGRLVINLEAKTGLQNQDEGVKNLETAITNISKYLADKKLTDVETPAGSTNATYYYPEKGEAVQTGYSITRSVIVRGSDLDTLTQLANNIAPLSGNGYTVSVYGLELTYSKLDEMRVRLLSEAIQDAKDRAEAIAQNTGRSVGPLRNATGGVVQVLSQGSVEVNDYGSYDTSSLNKDVMVTARVTFGLQ
jgi:uncharacterized protein